MYFYLAYIEVKRYFRDPGALGLSLALPIALLALMLGAFGSDPSFHGRATIVDLDKTPASARLIELIAAVPGVDVEMLEEERADRLLDRSARLLVTVIHEGYGDEVARGGSSPLLEFRQRGSGGDEGRIVASIIRGAAAKHAAEQQALRVVTSSAASLGLNANEAEIDDAVAVGHRTTARGAFRLGRGGKDGRNNGPVQHFLPGHTDDDGHVRCHVERHLDRRRAARRPTRTVAHNRVRPERHLLGQISCRNGPGIPSGVHIGHAWLGCVSVLRPVRLRRDAGRDLCIGRICRCHRDGHRFIRPNARTGELVGSDHHDGYGDDRGIVFRTCQGWDSRRHRPGLAAQVRKRRAENRPFGYGGPGRCVA